MEIRGSFIISIEIIIDLFIFQLLVVFAQYEELYILGYGTYRRGYLWKTYIYSERSLCICIYHFANEIKLAFVTVHDRLIDYIINCFNCLLVRQNIIYHDPNLFQSWLDLSFHSSSLALIICPFGQNLIINQVFL